MRGASHRHASTTLAAVIALLTATASGPVQAARWTAGGWLSASWAGGWPELDLRARAGVLVGGGHELGLTAGLTTVRLATDVLYLTHYSHTWVRGRRWPVVSLWLGGSTDVTGFIAQSRLLFGAALGLRVPIGRQVALRVDLGHELLAGARWADRTFLAVGLEFLGGAGWP
jgi:hypothetical protein